MLYELAAMMMERLFEGTFLYIFCIWWFAAARQIVYFSSVRFGA